MISATILGRNRAQVEERGERSRQIWLQPFNFKTFFFIFNPFINIRFENLCPLGYGPSLNSFQNSNKFQYP